MALAQGAKRALKSRRVVATRTNRNETYSGYVYKTLIPKGFFARPTEFGGYILKRVDSLLIDAANRVGEHIAALMRGEAPSAQVIQFRPRGRSAGSTVDAEALTEARK